MDTKVDSLLFGMLRTADVKSVLVLPTPALSLRGTIYHRLVDNSYWAVNAGGTEWGAFTAGDFAVYQGTWDPSTGAFPSAAKSGQVWVASASGAVDGVTFAQGNELRALVDGAATDTYAGNWSKEPARYTDAEARAAVGYGQLPYGVRWNQATDIMEKGVLVNGAWTTLNYSLYPIQDAHVRCMRSTDGITVRYTDPTDSNYYDDGTAVTFDGTEGDMQVESPRFYELWTRDGDDIYILISFQPFLFNGAAAQIPAHFGGYGHYYYDAFESVLYDDSAGTLVDGDVAADTANDVMRSLPGYQPNTDNTRAELRTMAAARGGTSHQWSWSAYQSLVALFVTRYATWDSQTALPGYTEGGSWDYAYTRDTGRTLGLGNASGSIEADLSGVDSDLSAVLSAGDAVANSFLGIENVFGHIWKFIDGINIDNTTGDCRVYVQADPDSFNGDTATGYIDTGHAPAFGDNDGYISDIRGFGADCPLYPTGISGASDTYLMDYHYNDSGSWRVPFAGGLLSNGAFAGLVMLYAHNVSSVSSSIIGSRAAARG